MRKQKVYVINKSGHDFSSAEKYGELVYLSEGMFSKYNLSHMYRLFTSGLMGSQRDDFILQTALPVMNIIACVIFALKHRRLNLLLYEDNRYIKRVVVFDSIRQEYTQLELDDAAKSKALHETKKEHKENEE